MLQCIRYISSLKQIEHVIENEPREGKAHCTVYTAMYHYRAHRTVHIGHCKLFSAELEHVLEADPTEGPVSWLVCGQTGLAAVGDVATPKRGVAVMTCVTCLTCVTCVTCVTFVAAVTCVTCVTWCR